MRLAILLALTLTTTATPAPASAQLRAATTELSGRVVDQTEGVLPGASVTILNVETGERQIQMTGSDGRFAFPPLPVGTYRIEASLSGFATRVVDRVALQVGNFTSLTLTLAVSATS